MEKFLAALIECKRKIKKKAASLTPSDPALDSWAAMRF